MTPEAPEGRTKVKQFPESQDLHIATRPRCCRRLASKSRRKHPATILRSSRQIAIIPVSKHPRPSYCFHRRSKTPSRTDSKFIHCTSTAREIRTHADASDATAEVWAIAAEKVPVPQAKRDRLQQVLYNLKNPDACRSALVACVAVSMVSVDVVDLMFGALCWPRVYAFFL